MDEPDGSENFWAVERIRSEGGILPFVEFSRMALYDPENGYYCRDRKRVGADRAADFQTNLSVRSTFAPLVLESLAYLLDGRDLGDFRFVEVGAEPESALFCGSEEHPFKDVEVVHTPRLYNVDFVIVLHFLAPLRIPFSYPNAIRKTARRQETAPYILAKKAAIFRTAQYKRAFRKVQEM